MTRIFDDGGYPSRRFLFSHPRTELVLLFQASFYRYSFDVRALALGRVSLGRALRGVMAPLGSARQRRKRLAVYALCGVVGLLGYGTAPNAMQSRGPDRVGRPDRVV